MKFKKTIAGRLLKIVFGLYFMIAFLLTLAQLRGEYFNVRDAIQDEIKSLQNSFEPILAEALWRYDHDSLKSTLFGMQKLSAIVGIRILDAENQNVYTTGFVNSGDADNPQMSYFNQDGEPEEPAQSQHVYERLFNYSFPIRYRLDDQNHIVGKGQLYSSNRVVVSRLEYSFFMIIINSLIKTISLWIIFIFFIRKIVSAPLKKLTEEAEQLNPENKDFNFEQSGLAESELLIRDDEVGVLAQRFDAMRKALAQRDEKIQDYQTNLEKKAMDRAKQLDSANRNIRAIVDNIEEGIFTISSKNLMVDPDYSGHLETIFGRQDIKSLSLPELLFADSDIGSDRIQIIKDCLKMMLTEDMVNFRLNEHLLPREIRNQISGNHKIFLVDWVAICSERGQVDKVMVSVRDVTEWVQLKKNFAQKTEEIQFFEQILQAPDYDLFSFLKKNEGLCDQIKQEILTGALKPDLLRQWMRIIHNSKGISRNLHLEQLSDAFHLIEEELESIIKYARFIGGQKPLESALSGCKLVILKYQFQYQKIIRHLAPQKQILEKSTKESLADIFLILMSGIPEMAAVKGIEEPFVELVCLSLPEIRQRDILLKILIHLVSNSVMHGIEAAADRKQKGKMSRGLISIEARSDDQSGLEILVRDDGKGIPLDGLKDQYPQLWEQHQNVSPFLNDVLFIDGFSAGDQLCLHSGRGVGLSAARELIASTDGDLLVQVRGSESESLDGKETEYIAIEFKLVFANAKINPLDTIAS